MGRHRDKRSAVHRSVGAGVMHVTRIITAAMAVALGRHCWRLYAADGTCGLSSPDSEARPGPDLWIVSRLYAGDCGGLRRSVYARGHRQAARREVGTFSILPPDSARHKPSPQGIGLPQELLPIHRAG